MPQKLPKVALATKFFFNYFSAQRAAIGNQRLASSKTICVFANTSLGFCGFKTRVSIGKFAMPCEFCVHFY